MNVGSLDRIQCPYPPFYIGMARTFQAWGILCLLLSVAIQVHAQQRQTIELQRDGKVLNLPEQDIYKATMLAVSDSTVYLFDYGQYRLIRYVNERYDTLAAGIGGGPEEFRNPTDIAADSEGNLWLADPEQARISTWNEAGELIHTFNHAKSIPERIAVHEGRFMIQVKSFSADELFYIFDENNKPYSSFGGINDSLLTSSFLVSGTLHADETGFYFAPMYAGHLYKFDRNGIPVFQKRTVEPMPVGKVNEFETEIEGLGTAHVSKPPPDDQKATLDLATNDQYLFVLFAGNEDGVGRIIDVYDKFSGEYEKSIGLYESTTDLCVSNGKLYMIHYDDFAGSYKVLIEGIPGSI